MGREVRKYKKKLIFANHIVPRPRKVANYNTVISRQTELSVWFAFRNLPVEQNDIFKQKIIKYMFRSTKEVRNFCYLKQFLCIFQVCKTFEIL